MPFGLSNNFIDRLRGRIKDYFDKGEPESEQSHVDQALVGPVEGVDQVMYRIRHAARTHTLLYMKYNGSWRHVEPYSFRYRSAGMQPLFYAWCQLHDEIHSFRIDRIQDVHTTDRVYAPRFAVEIA